MDALQQQYLEQVAEDFCRDRCFERDDEFYPFCRPQGHHQRPSLSGRAQNLFHEGVYSSLLHDPASYIWTAEPRSAHQAQQQEQQQEQQQHDGSSYTFDPSLSSQREADDSSTLQPAPSDREKHACKEPKGTEPSKQRQPRTLSASAEVFVPAAQRTSSTIATPALETSSPPPPERRRALLQYPLRAAADLGRRMGLRIAGAFEMVMGFIGQSPEGEVVDGEELDEGGD